MRNATNTGAACRPYAPTAHSWQCAEHDSSGLHSSTVCDKAAYIAKLVAEGRMSAPAPVKPTPTPAPAAPDCPCGRGYCMGCSHGRRLRQVRAMEQAAASRPTPRRRMTCTCDCPGCMAYRPRHCHGNGCSH